MDLLLGAQCYKTNCRVKLGCKMGFLTQNMVPRTFPKRNNPKRNLPELGLA
jgi:hypothetical protein